MARAFHERVWYYRIDPEVRVIHSFADCRDLKVAIKYKYATEFALREPAQADELDQMVRLERFKICHPCYTREQVESRREGRTARPGFMVPPPGYKQPVRREASRRQPVRTDTVRD